MKIYTTLNKKEPTFTRSSIAYLDGTQVASNVPRFTADGLMIEEGTTNIKSDPSFTAGIADWTNQATTMEWDKTFGRTDNYSMHVVGGAPNYRVYFTQKISAGEQLAFSCYIKSAGTPKAHMEYNGGDYSWKGFDGNQTSGVGKWERSYVVGEVATSDTVAFCFIDSIGDGYDAWIDDIQIEEKSYATSYINGTRAAESLTVPASVINLNGFTVSVRIKIADVSNNIHNSTVPRAIWGCNSSTNAIWIARNASNIYGSIYDANGNRYVIPMTSITSYYGQSILLTLTFDGSTAKLYINGALKSSASNVVAPTLINGSLIGVGCYPNGQQLTSEPISDFLVSSTVHTADKMASDAQLGRLQVEPDTTYYLPLDGDLRYLTYLF